MPSDVTHLAHLVDLLGAGGESRDREFVRRLSAALHERAGRIELPLVEALGLVDVVATFAMEQDVRLVVTGGLADGPGEVTVRWHERDFERVPVRLLRQGRSTPYLFATVDYRWRGHTGELLLPVGGLPAGQMVRVRALTSVGDRLQWRVQALGVEVSVADEGLRLVDQTGAA